MRGEDVLIIEGALQHKKLYAIFLVMFVFLHIVFFFIKRIALITH